VNPIDPVRLGIDDAGEILTLQRAAYVTEAQAHGDLALPPLTQTLEQLRVELADPHCTAWGIRERGRLVASGRIRLADPAEAEIGRLTVAPDRQGNGLGTALLLAAEARLPDDVTVIRLFTGEHSHANLRLYQRLGYRETGRTPAGSYHLVHLAKNREAVLSPRSRQSRSPLAELSANGLRLNALGGGSDQPRLVGVPVLAFWPYQLVAGDGRA